MDVKSSTQRTCILFGIATFKQPESLLMEYLDELAFLAQTAGAATQKVFYQKCEHPNTTSYFGKGKVAEVGQYISKNNISLAICDDDLSPLQVRHLEKEWNIQVLSRSALILDIFAMRAQTAQARTQVELAQLQYLLPHLRGMWTHLERQQGGIGSRGPGEKEIETDRRVANTKITILKKKLLEIDKQNQTQRKTRGEWIRVALVGYTNVGKSTIMKAFSKDEVFVENKLFATLDTLVRKITVEQTPFLLSDTVGFIRKLPHHLVESFKSTLDEVREADILLHVVDLSHEAHQHHWEVVMQTLQSIGIADKTTLTVFNKIDAYRNTYYDPLLPESEKKLIEKELHQKWKSQLGNEAVFISATDKENFEGLRNAILTLVKQKYATMYPYLTQFYK